MHALSKKENQMQWEYGRLCEPSLAKWQRERFETAFDDNHIGQGLGRIWLNSRSPRSGITDYRCAGGCDPLAEVFCFVH